MIIPVSKWLITMVIVSPLTGATFPFQVTNYLLTGMILKMPSKKTKWLINGHDPNHLRFVLGSHPPSSCHLQGVQGVFRSEVFKFFPVTKK